MLLPLILGSEQSNYLEIAIRLTAFAVLIALTAFFVASEFAIVKVRTTRIDQLVAEGNRKAITAKKVLQSRRILICLPIRDNNNRP